MVINVQGNEKVLKQWFKSLGLTNITKEEHSSAISFKAEALGDLVLAQIKNARGVEVIHYLTPSGILAPGHKITKEHVKWFKEHGVLRPTLEEFQEQGYEFIQQIRSGKKVKPPSSFNLLNYEPSTTFVNKLHSNLIKEFLISSPLKQEDSYLVTQDTLPQQIVYAMRIKDSHVSKITYNKLIKLYNTTDIAAILKDLFKIELNPPPIKPRDKGSEAYRQYLTYLDKYAANTAKSFLESLNSRKYTDTFIKLVGQVTGNHLHGLVAETLLQTLKDWMEVNKSNLTALAINLDKGRHLRQVIVDPCSIKGQECFRDLLDLVWVADKEDKTSTSTIGEILSKRMAELNLTPIDVANKACISENTLTSILSGAPNAKINVLLAVVNALDLEIEIK